jgi:hypothetical protein
MENLFIKSIFTRIRKERENQPIWKKELCIECIDRIEKKFLSITNENGDMR